ncbi:hypothetical protein SUGI_0721780 [Cryptomeria japonica]|nr:hypothetical protein SUGI_0721780 [Cryptomeria japonica]
MVWVQWVYAIWQVVRGNPLTLLVLSFLPFRLMQLYKKKEVVVLGDSAEYTMSVAEMEQCISNVKNMEKIERKGYWFKVKHNNFYYITHQNTLCELARCWQLFGDDIIFVENLLPITGSLSVGKVLSQTEAYEKVMSKIFSCSKGSDYVVPTMFDYGSDMSSKFCVRWRYCDTARKYAYVTEPDETVKITSYNKLESENDIEIGNFYTHDRETNDDNICMHIVKDRAHCAPLYKGTVYAEAVLKRPFFVSDHNLEESRHT